MAFVFHAHNVHVYKPQMRTNYISDPSRKGALFGPVFSSFLFLRTQRHYYSADDYSQASWWTRAITGGLGLGFPPTLLCTKVLRTNVRI